jgi:serine/threonine-protein kinase RsbW
MSSPSRAACARARAAFGLRVPGGGGSKTLRCVCCGPVGRPQITITFPAAPEFLRLARLTSADAGSRAGFDYEDIDDLRIAVSECCALIAAGQNGTINLEFSVEAGRVTVGGSATPGTLADNALSRTIVEAVVDGLELGTGEGSASFAFAKTSREFAG